MPISIFLYCRSQLYLKFKDELDQVEARAQPIIQEFRRLVEENANLDVSQSLSLSQSLSISLNLSLSLSLSLSL